MCILITVVEGAGRLFGVNWMSSNDDRISSVQCRIVRRYCTDRINFDALSMDVCRHAAVNNGRWPGWGLRSVAGGEAGERHHTASGVDRGGGVASEPGLGAGAGGGGAGRLRNTARARV